MDHYVHVCLMQMQCYDILRVSLCVSSDRGSQNDEDKGSENTTDRTGLSTALCHEKRLLLIIM